MQKLNEKKLGGGDDPQMRDGIERPEKKLSEQAKKRYVGRSPCFR